jgi:hypothetical protein
MKMEQWLSWPGVLALSLAMISCAPAYGFAGGSGTAQDPYQVATAAQLIAAGADPNLLDKHFVLVSDIDLDPNGPGGMVFQHAVISPDVVNGEGSFQGVPFTGTLDGRGHCIRHLTVSMTGQRWPQYAGLFGSIGQTGMVSHLSVQDIAIVVEDQFLTAVGGLAGSNAGRISQCLTSGTIARRTSFHDSRGTGGLVGENTGTVTQCASTVQVAGTGMGLGGLIGHNSRGEVVDCYAAGSVVGEATSTDGIGGLIGEDPFLDHVCRCYAAGSVTPASGRNAGGLIGSSMSGVPLQCYALRPVDGGGPDNGVGQTLSATEIQQMDSFVTWDFYGRDTDGTKDTWFMPSQGYPVLSWQREMTGLSDVPSVTGLSQAEAGSVLALAGHAVGPITYDYDGSTLQGQVIYAVPSQYAPPGAAIALCISLDPYDWGQNAGGGTAENPYQITQAGQLSSLHDRPDLWSSHFILMQDLDMTYRVFSGALLAADAKLAEPGFKGQPFGGRLNGNHHCIRNLSLSVPDGGMYAGLVGYVKEGAEILDLRLENCRVTTGTEACYVGLLAGYSQGSLSGCHVQGSIASSGDCLLAGGLIGFNDGSVTGCEVECLLSTQGSFMGGLAGVNNGGRISLCAIRGSIEGESVFLGGAVGQNSGRIRDTYSTADLSVRGDAGGLVGVAEVGPGSTTTGWQIGDRQIQIQWEVRSGGTIEHCYAAGRMKKQPLSSTLVGVGGLVGRNDAHQPVTASLWDVQATGLASSGGGIGLTTQQMMDSATLASYGFDLVNTWTLCEGKDYHHLWWEQVQCPE